MKAGLLPNARRSRDPAPSAQHSRSLGLLDHGAAARAGVPGVERPLFVEVKMHAELEDQLAVALSASNMPPPFVRCFEFGLDRRRAFDGRGGNFDPLPCAITKETLLPRFDHFERRSLAVEIVRVAVDLIEEGLLHGLDRRSADEDASASVSA